MDQNGERLQRRVSELVALPSPTGREKPVLEYLERRLQEMGFELRRQELSPGRWNLYARRGGGRFLLATHVDTVPDWGHPDGSRLRRAGDWLYGRGALDTKGQIAALLEACSDRSADVSLAFFVDEEDLAKGSEAFDWPWPGPVEGAVVLEPTGLSICTAQAGSFELEVVVPGKAWHGATFREGDNAILRALDLIARIRALPFWRTRDPRFPELGVTVGRISGGHDVQLIPDRCTFQVDMPVLPEHGLDAVRDAVLTILEKAGASYTVHHHDPPFETDENEAVVRTLARAHREATGTEPRFSGFTAWSDAENLVKKGIPSVVYGAGDLALAHTPEERVRLPDLLVLGEVLRSFLVVASQ